MIRIDKGTWSRGWGKTTGKIEPKDATYPTVSAEAVMLTATIDALEGQDVAVVDIPGAYLSADMDNEVHVVFRGKLAEVMVVDDPALYRTFLSYETGKSVLYVRLHKALYGWYSTGSAITIISASVPMNTTCTSFPMYALRYTTDMSTTATSRPSSASIVSVSMTAYVDTVGDVASIGSIVYHFFLPSANPRPFIEPY